jgi:hypothetical protein
MKNRYLAVTTTAMCVALAAAQPSEARVVKFVVEQRSPFVGGAEWGNAGPYEMLRGTAHLAVDPRDPGMPSSSISTRLQLTRMEWCASARSSSF